MDFLEDLRIVDGPVLLVAWVAGAACLFYFLRQGGLFRTRRPAVPRWLAFVLPVAGCLLCAAALLAGAHWTLIYLFSVFPGELPPEVLAWSLPGVTALLLWILHLWRTWRGAGRTDGRSGLRRSVGTTAVSTAALFGVVLLSAVQINAYFGLNHTVSDLTGTAVARIPPLEDSLRRAPGGAPGSSLSQWVPPADLPDGGVLRRAAIPGTSSGFQSREAYIYLPPRTAPMPGRRCPCWFSSPGSPGRRMDWLTGGASQPPGPVRGRTPRRGSGGGGGGPQRFVRRQHPLHGQQNRAGRHVPRRGRAGLD
ncbi:hypothetical protein ACOM2C_06220 [Pseudarthrobacter sp. So.54]